MEQPSFLAFQYSLPGGSTTAGEVCYLRLPCSRMYSVLISTTSGTLLSHSNTERRTDSKVNANNNFIHRQRPDIERMDRFDA